MIQDDYQYLPFEEYNFYQQYDEMTYIPFEDGIILESQGYFKENVFGNY